MTEKHWLWRLPAPQARRGPIAKQPWRLPAPWEGWSVATDACVLVAVREQVADLEFLPQDEGAGKLLGFLQPSSPVLWEGASADLAEWCGPPVWFEVCPECRGTSRSSPYVCCSYCDGAGPQSLAPRPGLLCGLRIDRNLLARGLHYLAPAVCQLHSPGAEDLPLHIVAPAWRVALMSMSAAPGIPSKEYWDGAPRFAKEVPHG